jgi:hypothetical protein
MSHISTVNTIFNCKDSIIAAAKSIGLEVVEANEFTTYNGQRDSCSFKMVIPGNKEAYECGFVENEDGSWDLQFDRYGGGKGMMEKIGVRGGGANSEDTEGGIFEAAYKLERSKRSLRKRGIRFREKRVEVNGRMKTRLIASSR